MQDGNAQKTAGRKPLSVYELTRDIKTMLESGFGGLLVEGEISGFKVYSSGHAYFTLKDKQAQIRAVIWKGRRSHVRFQPKDGDLVICRGRISVYEKRGEYQLAVEGMEPKGLGALQAEFEALKRKLSAEGLFDEQRKKPLPFIPWTVGIVTSPKGAAVRDMIRTINRRFPGLRIIINPAQVQGAGSAEQVANAIDELNRHGAAEVIIVGRGGGSLEDLWAFNEEVVARAIARSKIPIVSAVGHETDFTIADFVADLRASTPTAAGELVAPERLSLEDSIDSMSRKITLETRNLLETSAMRVDELADRSVRAMRTLYGARAQALKGACRHLSALSPGKKLALQRERLGAVTAGLVNAVGRGMERKQASASALLSRFTTIKPTFWVEDRRKILDNQTDKLTQIIRARNDELRGRLALALGKLESVNPGKVLERGYSLLTSPDGKKILTSVKDLKPGDNVKIRMRDGQAKATINGDGAAQQELF